MENEQIRVLHIDAAKEWRGGQQQVVYLCEKMIDMGFKSEIVCQPDSELKAFCLTNKLPFYALPMRNELDIIAAFRISRYAKQNQYKILHLHSAHALSIGLLARLFCFRLKLIAARRVDFSVRKPLFGAIKYNNFFIDKIICISDQIRKVLVNDGVTENKMITIHSGVDLHKFNSISVSKTLRQELNIPENHLIVGTVAALAGHKDYPNLLYAAKKTIEKFDNVTFCAVGDGPDKDKIFNLAENLQLGSRFIFCGFRKDVGKFLKMFDIFVLASRKEGLGTSLLDAQSVGLPIVATKAGGIPEAVYNNGNGLLVPPSNPDALAQAIIDLINSKDKRIKFGQRAKNNVQKFDINQTVNKTIKLYRELLT